MLKSLITSKTRRKLLALLFMNPKQAFYLREIARKIGEPTNAVSSELARLEKASLLTSERKANSIYYQVNPRSPIHSELKSLIAKTAGMGDVIRAAFQGSNAFRFAFIYGSYAKEEERQGSDIDLMLIGAVNFDDAARLCRKLEAQLGREVNFSLFAEGEFIRKKTTGFIKDVIVGKKIMLIGEEDEFERFAERGPD